MATPHAANVRHGLRLETRASLSVRLISASVCARVGIQRNLYVIRARDGLDVNVRLVGVGAAARYFYDGRRGRYAAQLECSRSALERNISASGEPVRIRRTTRIEVWRPGASAREPHRAQADGLRR